MEIRVEKWHELLFESYSQAERERLSNVLDFLAASGGV